MAEERLDAVINEVKHFAREREWDQFHNTKNLAMAVGSEAGELLAEYRWISDQTADAWSSHPDNQTRVANEAADVGIALLLFCDRVKVDLLDAIHRKLAINRANYPLADSRGKAERPGREVHHG